MVKGILLRKHGLAIPCASLIGGQVCQKSYLGDNGVVARESPHFIFRSKKCCLMNIALAM